MSNLYWPIYKNLEREVLGLSNLVHFDDRQMSVYSVKISEILMRCAVEIESISKDLYFDNKGVVPPERDLYFDTDCLKFLEDKWLLSKKVLILSSVNFYVKNESNRILTPLHKSFKRGSSGSDWKKAYQAVKHERVKSLEKGNVGNLIAALGALFILNLYYKKEVFELGRDNKANGLSAGFGSELFSVMVHKWVGNDGDGKYIKKPEFDQAVYFVRWTQESGDAWLESSGEFNRQLHKAILEHPKVRKFVLDNDVLNYKGNFAWDALGKDEYMRLLQQTQRLAPIKHGQLEYEAVLNVHDI